ncbi:MAG TPA: TetR/AcrR family transcriptional regulator [Alcanivoracaceae bacterium]|nr:TetR/AcrR family transcriptional regulator [Alcanivoracaceae bacterium]
MKSTVGKASEGLSVYGMDDSPRGKLLSAAARLFRDQGFDRTTVRDIAREVGLQSGSIFHHFATKEDILQAVMAEVISFNTSRLREAIEGLTCPTEKLKALVRSELRFIVGDTREAMTVLVYEWRCLSKERQQEVLGMRDEYEQIWLEVLTELAAAGRLTTKPFIARRLITGMTSWTNTWFDQAGDLTLDELTDTITQHTCC